MTQGYWKSLHYCHSIAGRSDKVTQYSVIEDWVAPRAGLFLQCKKMNHDTSVFHHRCHGSEVSHIGIIDLMKYIKLCIAESRKKHHVLCLWFRASLIYINNCPTRCNTKQSTYYSASSLYMFRVSTTPIIRSTQNCNFSFRYWSTWPTFAKLEGGSCTKNMTVSEAVFTVLCTPDD